MAVYKIFPQQCSTLYSYYPYQNTGLDEILEISNYSDIDGNGQISRALIKFNTIDITDILTNKIGAQDYKAYLRLMLADASEIPLDYSLFCYPLAEQWNMGTGRSNNVPITSDGVSWKYRLSSGSGYWTTSSFGTGITGSYPSSNTGGGSWYTSSAVQATQSFGFTDNKDTEIDVTTAISLIGSGSITNNGFIIKHSSSIEFMTGSLMELKYFSGNTHTIYPPCLEFRWNDFIYSTGSLSGVDSDKLVASLANNKGEFQQDSINKFRVNVREQFPTRTFQTSSYFLNNKVLPTASYWSIKDLDTDEIVIDYDTTYTKLSADSKGNYFTLYMSGLEPERFYKILIKTLVSGSTIVLDDNYYFKVIK